MASSSGADNRAAGRTAGLLLGRSLGPVGEGRCALLAPEASAQALVQAVNFLDPDNPTDFVSLALARNLAFAVGDTANLPESWAKEQIIPVLSRPDVRQKWNKQSPDESTDEQLAEYVLKDIDLACKLAEQERDRHEANAYWLNYVARRNRTVVRVVGALGIALLATWLGIAGFIAFKWFGI